MNIEIISYDPVTYICVAKVFTSDSTEYNLWRLSMCKRQEVWRVGLCGLDINTSDLTDAKIVGRASRCPIPQTRNSDFTTDQKFYFDVTGPAVFSTSDIQGLEFHRESDIAWIAPGKRVTGHVRLTRGTNKDHPCYSPIARIGILEDGFENGEAYTVFFKTKGILGPDEIIQNGIDGMYAELNETADRFDQTIIYSERVRGLYQFAK